MVVIYFPGMTYSNNKDAIKACFTSKAKWSKAKSGWFSNDIQIYAEFEGHHLPATFTVDISDKVILDNLISVSKNCGGQIVDEVPQEGAFCVFVRNPPILDNKGMRDNRDNLWRFRILNKVYWNRVDAIMHQDKSLRESFIHRWAHMEIISCLEDEEQLNFYRRFWE